jgi:hypothetical protein
MLERVRLRDIEKGVDVEAFTDRYACDEYSCLYLLSVAGRDSNVKAITSAAVSGRIVEVLSEPAVEAWSSYGQRYRIMSARLPGSALHQVVAEEGFFRNAEKPQTLLCVGDGDPALLVYEAVRRAYPVPLVREWSGWLYRRLVQEGHVRELSGTRKVLKMTLGEELLDSLVSEGVKSGEISF